MARGKKNNLAQARTHQRSLAEVRKFAEAAKAAKLEQERAKLEQEYRADRILNPIAQVPDYTNQDIIQALNQYLAQDAKDFELPILKEFLDGHYDFESFGAAEFERAYVIYDALELINCQRIDADFESMLNDEADRHPIELLPETIDYRIYYKEGKILAAKKIRPWMKGYHDLVEAGQENSRRALAVRKNLEDRGFTRSSCGLLMKIDAKLDAQRAFEAMDDN